MKSLCLLAAFSLPPAFFGCLNSPMVHTSLNGPTSAGQPLATKLTQIIERPAMANRPRLTDRANPQDRAVSAILSGDYSGGIAILQELETTQPGQYQTAANLGTAFELAGDNSQALYWIQQGLQRNPKSHQGTEWLHERILEAKLAADQGAALSLTERLIPLPEQTLTPSTVLTLNAQSYPASEVFNALSYQLQERLAFVKPEDRWAAECLFSLAVLQAHFYSIDDAKSLLHLAKSYGFPDPDRWNQQLASLDRSLLFAEIRYWTMVTLGGLAVLGALIFGYRTLRDLLSD